MDPTAANLQNFFTGLRTSFNNAFAGVTADWQRLAFTVPSRTGVENYAWMNDIPKMREWIGSRVMRQISESTYQIPNKTFEDTIVVPREKIEDDQFGIYGPLAGEMGRAAAEHPGELVFDLLAKGFDTKCYDGQNYFDEDHPVVNPESGKETSVSNMHAGDKNPWFVMDTTRLIKPIVYQERRKAEFNSMTDPKQSEHVFKNNEFVYGADMRCNVGFAFWQFSFGSKVGLDRASLRDAIRSLKDLKSDEGRKLGIRPNLLVVGSSNADEARDLIKAERLDGGKSNTDRDILEIFEAPYLD